MPKKLAILRTRLAEMLGSERYERALAQAKERHQPTLPDGEVNRQAKSVEGWLPQPSSPQTVPQWVFELSDLQREFESVKGKTFHSDWADFLFCKLMDEREKRKPIYSASIEPIPYLSTQGHEICDPGEVTSEDIVRWWGILKKRTERAELLLKAHVQLQRVEPNDPRLFKLAVRTIKHFGGGFLAVGGAYEELMKEGATKA